MTFRPNLGSAFAEIARTYSERTALLYPASGERVSYGELAMLVDRIARALDFRGICQGQVVAIFHDKSPAAFAAMLACLRLGIVYTNLDPESPWERLRKILDVCRPSLVVNAFPHELFTAELAARGHTNVMRLREPDDPALEPPPQPSRTVTGASAAYIMFTSGSTGTPKGAVMSHANLSWFIAWAQARFDVTADDVFTNVNPIYFDNSVFDFYCSIFSGAAMVPASAAQVSDPRGLVQLVNGGGCTVWFSVPSLLVYLLTTRALTAADFPAARKIVFGGEGFPKAKLKQLFELFGSRAQLENVYGPTECTCICSAHAIEAADFEDMRQLATLGTLSENFAGDILPQDETDRDFGELFLRGPQVGLGYFNDSERTRCAFVQNPRHADYTDIGYRTGDLVRRDARGRLHFKGRADFQIKHMGYRIELEEIEAALATLPEVAECAVVYQALRDGLGQIVAFAALHQPASHETLAHGLAARLPAYMLPRRIRTLDSLPKNANGKIDRTALHTLIEKEPA